MKRWLLCFALAASCALNAAESPLTPAQALASFRLEPGLRVELVAAEPAVVAPVALAFDDAGRLYVVENRGYPTGPGPGQPPAGVITQLTDEDGDDYFEKRTIFAEGLTFPNGILPWKGGVFVTCAPDVWYLKDTDGDGRADLRRVVWTGFDASNTSQLRVSHPTFGPDNWVYLTSGLTGGKIRSPAHPDRPALEIRSDSRFRPDADVFEAADGRAQFGMTFDDFGRRFICMNRVQVQHVVLPSRYLRRNPYLGFSETVENCPETKNLIASGLRAPNPATRIYPISQNLTTADSHAGTFTAACAVFVFRGDGLPEEFRGQAFSCDPTGNLVHRDKLTPSGATFVAERAAAGVEFLASTDDWFRPVFLASGPDGALYVCDMYRKTIEHPQYLPEEIRKRTDFESGKDRGRIYRVRSAWPTRAAGKINAGLGAASGAELCALLGHPNAWHRETAQRLLVERREATTAPLVRDAILNLQSPLESSPEGRGHALRTLEGLNHLDDASILRGLQDEHPGVREQSIQLAEPRLEQAPALRARVLQLSGDSDPRVRFQCALSLGEIGGLQILEPLTTIALRDADDRWTRAAVLSSLRPKGDDSLLEPFIEIVLRGKWPANPGVLAFLEELGRLRGASPTSRLADCVKTILAHSGADGVQAPLAFLAGLGEGLRGRGAANAELSLLKAAASSTGLDEATRRNLATLGARALAVVVSEQEPVATRVAAARWLAHAEYPPARAALLKVLHPLTPASLQTAAVRALGQMADPAIGPGLLTRERWQSYTPSLRGTVLAALFSQSQHLPALLDALENEAVPKSALTPAQRTQLQKHRNDTVRRRADLLFRNMAVGDRQKVFEDYQAVLGAEANPNRGRAVFKQHCASCHRLDREGVAVGPDLFEIRNQPKEAILLHIIIPEYEVAPGYVSYIVETKDGRTLAGLIASETPTSITLRRAQGEEDIILRANVSSMTSTALSLMPQELEKNMSRQEMADLVSYLKGE